jgi:beta-lactamase superfamily II metal-dependent hydrolase
MSGDTNTTQTFEDALDAINESGAAYHEPRTGEIFQIGSARLEVFQPNDATVDINNESIVIRVVFGGVAFLFTGDAEAESEQTMLAEGHDLHAQILKLGHHGSDTSSTSAFLQAVHPEVAVWSAGKDKQYGTQVLMLSAA